MSTERGEGKAKQVGGAIKKNIGKVVGDRQMEAEGEAKKLEGEAQEEAAKAAERTKGKIEDVAGKAQNRVGQVIDDDEMAAKGKAKELQGKLRQKANR